ncbi:hypothetical protein BBJ28_00026335 [Nothophytophthora sp. Chile5]|nr:hypothetical protein BBJ28_00026335 [Nothophytophthora sp. Chile5]
MLERYLRIRLDIKRVEAVKYLVPTGNQHRKIVTLFEHMKKLDSVCKKLQNDSTNMADVRLLFDSVVAEYPIMGEHLKSGTKIVHSPSFEAAVVKVINGSALSTAEATALQPLQVSRSLGKKRKERDDDYAAQILREGTKKRSSMRSSVAYSNLVTIPPTSNTVERLFSQCKLIMTPQRRCMLPANFEMISFLRVNKRMWNVASVAAVDDVE